MLNAEGLRLNAESLTLDGSCNREKVGICSIELGDVQEGDATGDDKSGAAGHITKNEEKECRQINIQILIRLRAVIAG